jgi:hypothetical protein
MAIGSYSWKKVRRRKFAIGIAINFCSSRSVAIDISCRVLKVSKKRKKFYNVDDDSFGKSMAVGYIFEIVKFALCFL